MLVAMLAGQRMLPSPSIIPAMYAASARLIEGGSEVVLMDSPTTRAPANAGAANWWRRRDSWSSSFDKGWTIPSSCCQDAGRVIRGVTASFLI